MIPFGQMLSFLWCKASCMKSCCQPFWNVFCQEVELTRPVRGKPQSWAKWENSTASGLSTTWIVHLLCNHLLVKASSLSVPLPKPVFYPGWEVGLTTAIPWLSLSMLMVTTPWAWEVPDLMDTTPFDTKTCSPTTQREAYLEQSEFCSQTLSESVRSALLPCRLLKWVQQASEQTVFPGNCRAPSPFYSAAAIKEQFDSRIAEEASTAWPNLSKQKNIKILLNVILFAWKNKTKKPVLHRNGKE